MHGNFSQCSATLMYVPAQLGLILQSIIAVASLCTTFYFLEKHIKRSSIHRNFKLLLFAHFVRSYLHVIVVLVASFSFIYRSFGANHEVPEEVFMNASFFKYLHSLYAMILVADITIKVLLVFERAIATCLVQGYENQQSCKTSWSYAGFIIIFPASVILLAYRNADFETPACFALNAPLNTESWVNIVFMMSLLLSFFALIMLRFIICINEKLPNLHLQLTTRYQISENLTCSNLLSTVLITGLTTTVFYTLVMCTLRLGQFQVFNDHPALFSAVKTWIYPLPLADLVIPIYSGMQMSKMKSVKIGSLNRAISRESSRQLATDTYEKIFKDQWA